MKWRIEKWQGFSPKWVVMTIPRNGTGIIGFGSFAGALDHVIWAIKYYNLANL